MQMLYEREIGVSKLTGHLPGPWAWTDTGSHLVSVSLPTWQPSLLRRGLIKRGWMPTSGCFCCLLGCPSDTLHPPDQGPSFPECWARGLGDMGHVFLVNWYLALSIVLLESLPVWLGHFLSFFYPQIQGITYS